MSGSSPVEFDFFSRESSSKKLSDRRDIQGVVSKINPELLKYAIASASANTPVSPMTIFFNGSVSVFEVTPKQAESVVKFAESLNSVPKNVVESTVFVKREVNQNQTIGGGLGNDLPMKRKRSLRRFLEKRKERHVVSSPYACSQGSTSSR